MAKKSIKRPVKTNPGNHHYKLEFPIDARGKHRWRVVGLNGKIVETSNQGFATRQKAKKNLNIIRALPTDKAGWHEILVAR